MIRAALVAGLLLGGPAEAEVLTSPPVCQALLNRLVELAAPVMRLSGEETASIEEGCLITDLRIDPGGDAPDWYVQSLEVTGALPWILDGRPAPARLGFRARGLRMVLQTDNPQMDYLFAAQSRANLIHVDLALAWDATARVLAVEGLKIDFPGENQIDLTAKVIGVDLSSKGAMQMSATGFALTEADLTIQSHGLFEWYALMALGPMFLPLEGDMEAAARVLRAELVAGLAELPDASFPAPGKAALTALVRELPNPSGTLMVGFRAKAGFGPARLMRYAMTGVPDSLAEALPLLDGVTFNIGWTHEDAP